jgi:hypothetical protein
MGAIDGQTLRELTGHVVIGIDEAAFLFRSQGLRALQHDDAALVAFGPKIGDLASSG